MQALDFEKREVMVGSIYVPVVGARLCAHIAPRSGVVGVRDGDGLFVYYEGNLNGASNLNTFEERVSCAAGRMFTNYPTTACMRLWTLPGENEQGESIHTIGELLQVGEVIWLPWRRKVQVDIRNMNAVAEYWNSGR